MTNTLADSTLERLFGLSDYFVPRFRDINADRLRREQSSTRKSTLWRASLGLAADAVVAGVWVFIALRALARIISVGDVVLGTQAAWRGKQALEATFSYGGQFGPGGIRAGHHGAGHLAAALARGLRAAQVSGDSWTRACRSHRHRRQAALHCQL